LLSKWIWVGDVSVSRVIKIPGFAQMLRIKVRWGECGGQATRQNECYMIYK